MHKGKDNQTSTDPTERSTRTHADRANPFGNDHPEAVLAPPRKGAEHFSDSAIRAEVLRAATSEAKAIVEHVRAALEPFEGREVDEQLRGEVTDALLKRFGVRR